eukprot:9182703-Pyramimonas_sp.AAC.1
MPLNHWRIQFSILPPKCLRTPHVEPYRKRKTKVSRLPSEALRPGTPIRCVVDGVVSIVRA